MYLYKGESTDQTREEIPQIYCSVRALDDAPGRIDRVFVGTILNVPDGVAILVGETV